VTELVDIYYSGNSTYSFCSFIDVSITPKSCLELFLENVQVPVFERLLGNNIFHLGVMETSMKLQKEYVELPE
jgi:hypothetical protein